MCVGGVPLGMGRSPCFLSWVAEHCSYLPPVPMQQSEHLLISKGLAGCEVSGHMATVGQPGFQALCFCSLCSQTQPSLVPTASTKPTLGPRLVPRSIQQVHN